MSKISKEAKKEETVKRLEELLTPLTTIKGMLKSLTDLQKNMIVLFITSLKPATL